MITPIRYHPKMAQRFNQIADRLFLSPGALRAMTEVGIRFRRDEAFVYLDRGHEPAVHELDLGHASVLFSVEARVIVVYGYLLSPPEYRGEDEELCRVHVDEMKRLEPATRSEPGSDNAE